LERLSRQETHDLLAAMFGEEITPDFLDGIFRQTEGNPFFIEEVCKALIEAGQPSFREGRWHRPAMAEMKIPQTVYSAIRARLQKLPDFTQEVLHMAAILGSDFDFETLKYACDLDEETLISALEGAERAQLIAEAPPGQMAPLRFNFVHVLIPTTMRESTIHVRRRRLKPFIPKILKCLRISTPKRERWNAPGNFMCAQVIGPEWRPPEKPLVFIEQHWTGGKVMQTRPGVQRYWLALVIVCGSLMISKTA
jgi:hypothetical protein